MLDDPGAPAEPPPPWPGSGPWPWPGSGPWPWPPPGADPFPGAAVVVVELPLPAVVGAVSAPFDDEPESGAADVLVALDGLLPGLAGDVPAANAGEIATRPTVPAASRNRNRRCMAASSRFYNIR